MTRLDKLVVALALVLVMSLFAAFWQPGAGGEGERVEVLVAGEVVRSLPLDRDGRFEIAGRLGPSLVEVAQGRVRFVRSPCPGKLCVHAGWLHLAGETSFCLPNGVGLRVAGLHDVYDAINF